MAFVAPFRGLRFNPDLIENMEDVVTPPYDVVDSKKQAAFLARNPYNMMNLDLMKEPGEAAAATDRYSRARNFFELWQKDEVLIRDEKPAFYLYHTEYSLPSGRKFTRKGLVALVRLAEFSEGIVKPHEETFATVAADRLRLMDETQAQFSQIFSLYSDKEGQIMTCLEAARKGEPLYRVKDADRGEHSIWPITDPDVLNKVHALFRDKPVYIADGHHRYTTALNFRKLLNQRGVATESDSPYNHTMMYLCPMEDPGLSVLPTHRLIHLPHDVLPGQATMDKLAARLAPGFQLEEILSGSREALVDEVLARMSETKEKNTVFGLYHAGEDRCFMLTMKEGFEREISDGKRPPALRDLDVVILSDQVLGNLLGVDLARCERENLIGYYSDPDEALDVAVKESVNNSAVTPLLFLMNNTQVSQIKRVADENLFMPHKSTYFYPKILTGLLMNKFVPEEKVRI